MPVILERRLSDLRRGVQRTLWIYGLGWLGATFVGLALAACLGDWAFHFDDAGVRLILALTIIAASAWVAFRRLIEPLRVPLTDVDLALRIEDRYPGFQDSLASSVQFLERPGDRRIGSPALQQSVIVQTLSRMERVDEGDVLQTREVRRIAFLALAVCLVAIVIGGLDGRLTSLALRRLFAPVGAPPWPRQTSLRLLDAEWRPLDPHSPLALSRGDVLKLYAENSSGGLPDRVVLEVRDKDGQVFTEAMRPQSVSAEQGPREVAVGQLAATNGDVEFRAVGGDDDSMAWHTLRVIPPPVIERLNVRLIPPAYLGKPAVALPDGVGHLEALVGTRVEIAAVAGKPLRSATVRVRDQQRHPVALAADRRTLESSFVISQPGVYSWWFDLEDVDGFENADPARYELRALQDAEPEVRMDLPASDLRITPDAQISVRAVARDDLGLAAMRLMFRRDSTESSDPGVIPLFTGEERPREQSAEHDWDLTGLALQSGERIVFHAEATDEFDLSDAFPEGAAPPPHVGRSVSRTLTVVSNEDKLRELAERQAGLLDDLEKAQKEELQARDQVQELQTQWDHAGRLRPEDLDSLQRAEVTQRGVSGRLTGPATGLERRARDMLDELRQNRLDDTATERRLTDIAEELQRLGTEHLPRIESELTQARKLAQAKSGKDAAGVRPQSERSSETDAGSQAGAATQQPDNPADKPDVALRQAAADQQAVLESLSEMLQELSQWRSEHDAARELGDLIRSQTELNRQTAELGGRTLTKPRDSLVPQEQADLTKLADRQRREAGQLEQLETRIEERIDNLSQSDPSAAATLRDALEQSREQGVGAQMSEAGGQISENRMGEAARSQAEVLEKLEDLAATLNGQQGSDTEALVKKLKEAEQELAGLRDREADVLRKVRDAQQVEDQAQREAELQRLRKEQEQLREETARQARRLQRLQARRPAVSAQRAAARMQQAQQELEDGNQAAAADQQQEALDDLEQAQRELARERRRAEEQLAREQLDRIASELAALIGRQQGVIDETRRLDALRRASGRLARAQLAALRDTAESQRQLQADTGLLAEKLTAAEVFALALRGAVRHMQRAVALLEGRATGEDVQQAQENALRRFVELTEALRQDQDQQADGQPQQAEQQGGAGEDQGQPQGDGIPAVAQLKMLLALQRELLERTARLGAVRDAGQALTILQQAELEAIATEQSELADLARNLSSLASEADDDAAESDDREQDEAGDEQGSRPEAETE